MQRYLVECNTTVEACEATRRLLSQCECSRVKEMNNYDGTHDFIIECEDKYVEYLQSQGLTCIRDASLYFETVSFKCT